MRIVILVIAVSFVSIAAAQEAKINCPKGQFYDFVFGSGSCEECERGSYKAKKGPQACEPCPVNSFSKRGATKCTKCPEHQALLKNGKCGSCPPGSFYDKRELVCKKCPSDTFQANENTLNHCFSCSGDTFSEEGATSCRRCPAGTAPMKNGKCGVCPPGTFYKLYNRDCQACERGTFQPNKNIREEGCLSCSGDTNSDKGATGCTKCPFGKVPLEGGKCGICRPGSGYSAYELKCRRCRFNEYSSGSGIFQKCKECLGSFYSRPGATECAPCPVGTALVVKKGKAACRACPTGTRYDRLGARCEVCFDTSGLHATGARGISPGGDIEQCSYCRSGDKPNADKTKCL